VQRQPKGRVQSTTLRYTVRIETELYESLMTRKEPPLAFTWWNVPAARRNGATCYLQGRRNCQWFRDWMDWINRMRSKWWQKPQSKVSNVWSIRALYEKQPLFEKLLSRRFSCRRGAIPVCWPASSNLNCSLVFEHRLEYNSCEWKKMQLM
jgi:hypothetical protein